MSGISSNEKKSKHKGMLNWNLFLIVVILFEFLIFGAANQKFLNISSMFRSMNDFVPIGIIGIFVTLVMITGGIDIQAGSIVGLTSIIIGVAWQDWGMNIWAAVVLAIVIAILCGTLTGFFIAYCGVQAMVATLGGSFLYAGLALMVSTLSDTPSYMGITNFPDAFRNITKFKIGTISPGPVLVFVIIAVIMGIVLHKTKYGRKIFLVGVNQNAGEFSAVKLTTNVSETEQWQGGDIVIFERHIGIVSDRRNKNGVPYIIHHNDPWQTAYEQDILEKRTDIVGHYRISK